MNLPMLTEDEKARIRAEIEYRELVLRELHPPKARLARFWGGCGHPVIITLLGGLLLAAAGEWLQQKSALQQQDIAHLRHLQDSKYELLEAFCKEFERDMTLQFSLRMKQLYLLSGQDDPFGRSKDEVTKQFVELSTYYYQNCHPQALLQKTTAVFSSQQVKMEAKALIPKVKELLEISPPQRRLTEEEFKNFSEQVVRLGRETNQGMYSLVAAMGQEVREPR